MNWTSVPFLPHPHRPRMLGRESKDYTEYSDWKDVTGNKTPAPEKSGHMLFGQRCIQVSRWVPASGMVIIPRHECQHPKTTVPTSPHLIAFSLFTEDLSPIQPSQSTWPTPKQGGRHEYHRNRANKNG